MFRPMLNRSVRSSADQVAAWTKISAKLWQPLFVVLYGFIAALGFLLFGFLVIGLGGWLLVSLPGWLGIDGLAVVMAPIVILAFGLLWALKAAMGDYAGRGRR